MGVQNTHKSESPFSIYEGVCNLFNENIPSQAQTESPALPLFKEIGINTETPVKSACSTDNLSSPVDPGQKVTHSEKSYLIKME